MKRMAFENSGFVTSEVRQNKGVLGFTIFTIEVKNKHAVATEKISLGIYQNLS